MVPDLNLKDYYLKFIHDAEKDIQEHQEKLRDLLNLKNHCLNYLNDNKNQIDKELGINLDKYSVEFGNKQFNPLNKLYKDTLYAGKYNNRQHSANYLQLVKYCNILIEQNRHEKAIAIAKKRNNLKYSKYRTLVANYYNQVHKTLLQGMGYEFGYGIGTFVINRWKMKKAAMAKKKVIDFAATNKKKKELLEKGCKLYNDIEAAWYKKNGLPYDGVDYRVYMTKDWFYEFTIINSKIFSTGGGLDYKQKEYIHLKYRNYSTEQMALLCKSLDDIVKFNVDLKHKLNMYLKLDPTCYLNFIRNVEQQRYIFRPLNC